MLMWNAILLATAHPISGPTFRSIASMTKSKDDAPQASRRRSQGRGGRLGKEVSDAQRVFSSHFSGSCVCVRGLSLSRPLS